VDASQNVSFANATNLPNTFGMKNRFINGRFDVWQRSVGPVTGSGYTTADRWFVADNAMVTQRVANDRNTSIPYALQVTASSAGYGICTQRIEDVRSLSGGSATFSFWAKSSSTGVFRFLVEQNFGSGGSADVSVIDNASYFNMTSANTWQFFTATVTIPSVSGKTIGAGSYLQVGFGPNSGTASRVFTYSEMQFEYGTQATSFDFRSIGTELQLCQRYAYPIRGGFSGFGNGTTVVDAAVNFPVEMRAAPSVTQGTLVYAAFGTGGAYTQSSNLNSLPNFYTQNGGTLRFSNFSGLTANSAYILNANATTSAVTTYACILTSEL
jgi:hypothetical protein